MNFYSFWGVLCILLDTAAFIIIFVKRTTQSALSNDRNEILVRMPNWILIFYYICGILGALLVYFYSFEMRPNVSLGLVFSANMFSIVTFVLFFLLLGLHNVKIVADLNADCFSYTFFWGKKVCINYSDIISFISVYDKPHRGMSMFESIYTIKSKENELQVYGVQENYDKFIELLIEKGVLPEWPIVGKTYERM